jgi:hypothetical protein
MNSPLYPSLYQINTRVWLTALSRDLGRRATLDNIPDSELDHLAAMGFDWIWLLSVWQTGAAAQAVSCFVLPDVFERTWGIRAPLFWPEATRRVRERTPGFCFMAEVYWGREWDIQQQGFDYAYDKTLYDRLREGHARPVRDHFYAGLDYQNKLARFLENHDEPRAAATFAAGGHEAAAVITFLAPGLRFFHQGQFEGRLKRISPHLGRGPDEAVNESVKQFYGRLLEVLRGPAVRDGEWRLLECAPAWDGNGSNDAFIAFAWQQDSGAPLLVTVNYAGHASQCYVRLPFANLGDHRWQLRDLLGEAQYERDGEDLRARGLYLDLAPWQFHAFEMKSA